MRRSALAVLASMLMFAARLAEAANWPQFRGPQASGIDPTTPLPQSWDVKTGENIRWQTAIPGLAHAAPIIWGDRLYVATAVGGKQDLKVGLYGDIASVKNDEIQAWRLLALDKHTGKVLWDVLAHQDVPKVARHTKATHANSTPATDGRHIVAIFGSEGLFCFDLTGKLLWRKDLGPQDSGYFQVPSAQWGFASSPVIHDGKVIVVCDVQKDSYVAAFELTDGREAWRTARTDVPTWGTPTVITAAGKTQVAVNGWHQTGGYDIATGRELWRHDGGGDIPVPTPITAHGLIYFTSAHGRSRPIRAVKADATGDVTPKESGVLNPAVAWEHDRKGNYMQTPIVIGDILYACNDLGLVTAFDAKTGAIHYSERLAKRSEGFTASPVSDGRHLYFTSELGNVYGVPVGTAFAVAFNTQLEETTLATPAISEGTLYFRTRDRVVAVGSRP